MADITIAPEDVLVNGTSELKQGIAGAAMSAGTWVYEDTDRTLKAAQADDAATSEVVGILANNCVDGGYAYYNDTLPVGVGAVIVKDVAYVLSAATAGKMAPYSDLASTNIIVLLGVAGSTSSLTPAITNTGIVKT